MTATDDGTAAGTAGAGADDALARAVEDDLRLMPAVTALYPSSGLVARLADAGARLIRPGTATAPVVSVSRTDGGVAVEAEIGVADAAGAAETVAAAREAVVAAFARAGEAAPVVRITVVRVDESARTAETQRPGPADR